MRKFENLNEDELMMLIRYLTKNGYRVEIHKGISFNEKLHGLVSLCEGYDLFILGRSDDYEDQ